MLNTDKIIKQLSYDAEVQQSELFRFLRYLNLHRSKSLHLNLKVFPAAIMLKIVVVAAILSALIGCQDAPPRQVESPHKVTLASTHANQPDSALVLIADVKGFFTEEGLNVQFQMHTFGKSALGAVLENKADLATVAETPVMFAVNKREKLFIVAGIFTTSRNNALIGRKDKGISQPTDLRGKRIGYSAGTTGDFFMDSLLAVNGIERTEVVPVDLKPEQMFEYLTSGGVDAASTWNPPLALLRKAFGENAVTFFDKHIYTQTFTIAGQQEFVQNNPETIKRFLRALIKAEQFILEHNDEAQTIVAGKLKIGNDDFRELWSGFRYHVSLDRLLIITLQDETRWAIKNRLIDDTTMPNYRHFIYDNALRSIRPGTVNLD